jgi:DNA mismatch repair protein MutS2
MTRAATEETLEQLEFSRAVGLVAEYAVSDLGAAAVRRRRPRDDQAAIAEELREVAELLAVYRDGEAFQPRPVPDLQGILTELETEGSVLEAAALLAVGDAIRAMVETRAALESLAESAPLVAARAVSVPPARLAEAIERALERDGRVKDNASPALKRARQRVRDVRTRLVDRLERMARDLDAAEGGVTLKGGRYVLPVRRGQKSTVQGIVHGESASGATLFVEPADVVDLGNELGACESQEAREVLAVLRELTSQARDEIDRLAAGWAMCITADDVYARARYALDVNATVPTLGEPGSALRLHRATHPVILADASAPVAFDLVLDEARTMVVSGPNAGGKTVLLKAAGLVAALAQSGIIPPLGSGSTLPVFRRIFADIGDHQSIEASLSTFSAHVAALRTVLDEADDAALVLLDELGGGTDPVEGAALAQGVLLSLHRRGAVTIGTTHLGELKELASGTPGVANASLEFDAETLAPTYRFLQGRPGRSYALQIARQLGLPADVLSEAERCTPEAARTLEATLEEVERRERALERREQDVDALRCRLEADAIHLSRDRDESERLLRELSERERELERTGREQARKFLLEARKRVEEALGTARAAVNEATAKEARRLVEEGVREEGDALKRLEEAARKKGWRVRGDPVGPAGQGEAPSTQRRQTKPRVNPATIDTVTSEAATELDLRGMRVDEAEQAVIQAIDDGLVADLGALRIIHGKGTGALREAVQALLRADRRVASFKLAPPQQGGAGVTLVEFR